MSSYKIERANELAEKLMKLGKRPLGQIITVSKDDDWFNQIEDFMWDPDNDELEVCIKEDSQNES